MISVAVNARNAVYTSNDLITSGSIGIPVKFALSADFDGLSNIAVFQGSGVSVDVALTATLKCVVPHEVLANAGGYLRIGVYGRNGDGSIAIPTVWTASMMILAGTVPSGVDPAAPTPDWTAQVQQMATEALEAAESVVARADAGEFDGEPGEPGAVFTPAVSAEGVISWTNNSELPNPEPMNIKGAPGDDGISPTITVTDITGGHRVTITDETGPHSFDVMDGTGSVQDVQVVGVSVLDAQGVANVPMASPSVPGVIVSGTIAVSGTTPTITALPGIRYVCGEVATLDITLPASGIVDVVFESGSTPTVLTVTPPSGVTVQWANGFDPNALEANTTYEINIADGLGVAASWT